MKISTALFKAASLTAGTALYLFSILFYHPSFATYGNEPLLLVQGFLFLSSIAVLFTPFCKNIFSAQLRSFLFFLFSFLGNGSGGYLNPSYNLHETLNYFIDASIIKIDCFFHPYSPKCTRVPMSDNDHFLSYLLMFGTLALLVWLCHLLKCTLTPTTKQPNA